jgi:hypothetical protein
VKKTSPCDAGQLTHVERWREYAYLLLNNSQKRTAFSFGDTIKTLTKLSANSGGIMFLQDDC